MPETRAPRYPAASPTRRIGAAPRSRRYRTRRSLRSPERGPSAYWLNVQPTRADASAWTNSWAPTAVSAPSEIVRVVLDGVRPLGGRARWAVIALFVVIATDILAIGSDFLEIRLMGRLVDGENVSSSSLDSDEIRQGVAALVVLVAYAAAIVLFIRWFNRAYSNLPALRSRPRFKRGWAIGGWFVPILWFWRPKQIANDIWRGSDPSPRSLQITKTGVGPLLGLWWAAWIIGGFIFTRSNLVYLNTPTATDAGVSAMFGSTEDAQGIRYAAILDVVASSIDIAAAVLAILVVRELTSRELERERMLATVPDAAPAAESATAIE